MERPHIVGEGVLSTTLARDYEIRTIMGTEAKVTEMGVNGRSSAAAEKSGEGMALKIFTGAKPSLIDDIKPFWYHGNRNASSYFPVVEFGWK